MWSCEWLLIFGRSASPYFNPENRGGMFLPNAGSQMQDYMTPQHRGQQSTYEKLIMYMVEGRD
jgi:hypothetical protein